MSTSKFKFARICSITGEGMNEGWVINGGVTYIKYEDDVRKYLIDNWNTTLEEIKAEMDDEDNDFDSDSFYWTEWADLDDEDIYYEADNEDGINPTEIESN